MIADAEDAVYLYSCLCLYPQRRLPTVLVALAAPRQDPEMLRTFEMSEEHSQSSWEKAKPSCVGAGGVDFVGRVRPGSGAQEE